MASAAALPAAGMASAVERDWIEGDPRSQLPVVVLDSDVAGTYAMDHDLCSVFMSRGFLRFRRGRVTRFDYPGAEPLDPGLGRIRPWTFVNTINHRGQMVGSAFVPAGARPRPVHHD